MQSKHTPVDILIVDDSDIDNLISKLIIEKTVKNSKTFACNNGQEAIDHLADLKNDDARLLPDYIFVDLKMPKMDGWQFINRFNALNLDPLKKCKIYILSSSISKADIIKANSNPLIEEFISKPINGAKIEKILKAA